MTKTTQGALAHRQQRLIDKGRPELGYGTRDAKLHARPITVSHPSMVPHDKERADPAHQITALQAKIKSNLYQINQLTKAGRLDKAVMVCQLIATQRARVLTLTATLADLSFTPGIDADPIMRPAKTQTVVKAKHYKRFSGK